MTTFDSTETRARIVRQGTNLESEGTVMERESHQSTVLRIEESSDGTHMQIAGIPSVADPAEPKERLICVEDEDSSSENEEIAMKKPATSGLLSKQVSQRIHGEDIESCHGSVNGEEEP